MEFYYVQSDIGYNIILKAHSEEEAIEEFNSYIDFYRLTPQQVTVEPVSRLQAVNIRAQQLGIDFEELEEEEES